jgi:hypothetical protein
LQGVIASFKNVYVDDYLKNPLALQAANKINAAARGYLARKRNREFHLAMFR